MGTMANSEDPDEMPRKAAFHLGLHCLLRQDLSSEKEIQYFFKIIICDPLINIQWTILTLLCLALWKFPLILKGLF